jgi:hypothetical protein
MLAAGCSSEKVLSSEIGYTGYMQIWIQRTG